MTLIQQRDAILDSLRSQFKAKVFSLTLKSGAVATPAMLDSLLRDLANNIAQGLVDE